MLFSGRAYYNILIFNELREGKFADGSWESFDYRQMSLSEIFFSLEKLGVYFTVDSFLCYSEEIDTPEELTDKLQDENGGDKRKIYVLVFELWRRLLKEKKTISIFCDELDHTIATYETHQADANLYEGLLGVLEILYRNSPFSEAPSELFKRLSLYIAHDLENVIFTYIESKIGSPEEEKMILLLDAFLPFVGKERALKLIKLTSLTADQK
jgi:hypothetical protein